MSDRFNHYSRKKEQIIPSGDHDLRRPGGEPEDGYVRTRSLGTLLGREPDQTRFFHSLVNGPFSSACCGAFPSSLVEYFCINS